MRRHVMDMSMDEQLDRQKLVSYFSQSIENFLTGSAWHVQLRALHIWLLKLRTWYQVLFK